MTEVGGTWTYEDLNHWLENPGSFVRGTSMSFAGLRKDPDRINVIAYLASQSPNAPPFPEPLPAAAPTKRPKLRLRARKKLQLPQKKALSMLPLLLWKTLLRP